jgi:putative ABC transport system permease protein
VTADRRFRRSVRAYGLLVALFPAEFRRRYGADMRDLFVDQVRAAHRRRGGIGVVWTFVTAALALVRAAVAEHRSVLTPQSARRPRMLENTKNDLTFAVRMLRKSPIFTVVAVVAISLGAGAVATIFSAMNAMVLRPLQGVPNASRLVGLQLSRQDGGLEIAGSSATYEGLRDGSTTLSGLAAWGRVTLSISAGSRTSGDGGAVVAGSYASGNYFSVLGLRPALGRFFAPEEDRTPNTHPVVVVSHAFWSARLGGDSSAIGKPVTVNGHQYTLIGVAPEGFRGVISLVPVDGWVPLMMQGQIQPERNLATARWLRMFGRLRDGATNQMAQAELTTLMPDAPSRDAAAATSRRLDGVRVSMLRSVPEDARVQFLGFMTILLVAAGFVLFIASVNVAAMLSARAVARRREMALRSALGASRARLVTQLLTEILLLFGIGAGGAVGLAFAATHLAARVTLPVDVVVPPDMSPDLRVMAFALLVSLGTGVAFGLMPALRAARDDVAARLRDGSAGSGTRRSWTGNALIVGQLALSLVLLVAAGLFFRAVDIGARVNAGFDRSGLSIASFDTRTWGYDEAKGRRFYSDLRTRIASLPGVTDAAFASFAPLTTRSMNDSIALATGDRLLSWFDNVGSDYFTTIRMPLVAGRGFAATDDERAPRVAVINETLAKRIAPTGGAVGTTFQHGPARILVVGVVRDAKYAAFDEVTPPMVFSPISQVWQSNQTLLIRTAIDRRQLALAVRGAVRAIDPTAPPPPVESLARASEVTVLPQRIAVIVTGVLGGVGLLLAAMGLYGVMAYSVNRRTREMGVRIALGAQPVDVLRLVVGEGARLVVAGVVLGVMLAAVATRVIASLLFDVSALDVATFAAMSVGLVAVSLLASYFPARRAAGFDPMTALRSE